jgi:predicted cobalt transporter CbtA
MLVNSDIAQPPDLISLPNQQLTRRMVWHLECFVEADNGVVLVATVIQPFKTLANAAFVELKKKRTT